MNERIKELWDQAQEEIKAEYEDESRRNRRLYNEIFLPKFAELIVQECISIVDEQKECLHEEQKYWHDRDYGYEMAVNDASKGIKQFFGVEE